MRKVWSCVMAVCLALWGRAQDPGFASIDQRVSTIEAPTTDSLGRLLAAPYTTDLAKARAIYSWIAQHISYNTAILKGSHTIPSRYMPEPEDTAAWKSADEMTAQRVLRRRMAVCDGYSRLFKTLCEAAGLRSEIVPGYARGYADGGARFRTNHTWNAVMVDSAWRLVDVTWGSGYVTWGNQFVQHLDERYFLTPPEQFGQDHLPEDPGWTLTEEQYMLHEFNNEPFRLRSFIKYSIQKTYPEKGVIEAAMGDTLWLELAVVNPDKDRSITSDPFFDSTVLTRSSRFVFLEPHQVKGRRILYRYIVQNERVDWLNLFYNGDLVLRYRLKVQ